MGGDTLRIHRHRDCRTIGNEDMSPQEKAKELVEKYISLMDYYFRQDAKQFAIVAVNEILSINSVDKDVELSDYWEEVKQQIQKL